MLYRAPRIDQPRFSISLGEDWRDKSLPGALTNPQTGEAQQDRRDVVFRRHPDNLHWVWDTGLLEYINRNPAAFAADLEGRTRQSGVL